MKYFVHPRLCVLVDAEKAVAIDPKWMGEKPRAYRYAANGSRTAVSGVLTAKELAQP